MSDSYNNAPSYHDVEKAHNEKARDRRSMAYEQISNIRTANDTQKCSSSPVGAAIAGKQHLLAQLEERRQWYSARVTENFANAQRHAETIQRLTTAISILTLNPNFAEFCELLGLKVP